MEKGNGIEECQRPGRCEEKGVPALEGARVSKRKEIRRRAKYISRRDTNYRGNEKNNETRSEIC